MPLIVSIAVAALLLVAALRALLGVLEVRRNASATLARQPDRIHLVPAGSPILRRIAAPEKWAQALMSEGFFDVGWFSIQELPGVALRLLVHEVEGWRATIHATADGASCEIVALLPTGGRIAFTSLAPTGLRPTPGLDVVRHPGASPERLLHFARAAELPGRPVLVAASDAARAYENGWAEIMAARKAPGISGREIASVASQRPRKRIVA